MMSGEESDLWVSLLCKFACLLLFRIPWIQLLQLYLSPALSIYILPSGKRELSTPYRTVRTILALCVLIYPLVKTTERRKIMWLLGRRYAQNLIRSEFLRAFRTDLICYFLKRVFQLCHLSSLYYHIVHLMMAIHWRLGLRNFRYGS